MPFAFDRVNVGRLRAAGFSLETVEKLRYACVAALASGWFDTKRPLKSDIQGALRDIRKNATRLRTRLTNPPAALRSDFYEGGVRVDDLIATLTRVVDLSDQLLTASKTYKVTGKAATQPVWLIFGALPEDFQRKWVDTGKFSTIVEICYRAMRQESDLERVIHAFRTELRDPNGPRNADPNDLLQIRDAGERLDISAPT